MSTVRTVLWLLLIPIASLSAQSDSASHRPPPRAVHQFPASRDDTSMQRFAAIRARYQTEINSERAALQRSMDHMREDLVAAGWRPRMMMRRRMGMRRFAMGRPGGMMGRGIGRGAMMGRGMMMGHGGFAMRRGPMAGRGAMMRRGAPAGAGRGFGPGDGINQRPTSRGPGAERRAPPPARPDTTR